jgi:hypothetical protein
MPRLLHLLVALAVLTAGLLVATTTAGAVRPVACGDLPCDHAINAGIPAGAQHQHPAADPCLEHPLCGESGATTGSASLPLAALAALGLPVGLGLLAGRRMWPVGVSLPSALLVSGLERPPRRLV